MQYQALEYLRCPGCGGTLQAAGFVQCFPGSEEDIQWGFLECRSGGERFPILGGVAVLVEDVPGYIRMHARGIRDVLDRDATPAELRSTLAFSDEASGEYLDWELESGEVNSLYLASHYLTGSQVASLGVFHPAMESLIRSHWDAPLEHVEGALRRRTEVVGAVLELGCSVGGALRRARRFTRFAVGIDHCFRSVFTARSLQSEPGAEALVEFRPDLLAPVKRIKLDIPLQAGGSAEFVVGDILRPPVARKAWDAVLSLNIMDVLACPEKLPELQAELLNPGGTLIHTCPYQWPLQLLPHLRSKLPVGRFDSAEAVEELYRQNGFAVRESIRHVPWLFFEHERRLDVYSAHMMVAELRLSEHC